MSNDRRVFIVTALRTPFDKFGGPMRSVHSTDLGAHVIREIIARAGVSGEMVDILYYGACIPAETSLECNIPARQALLKAGMPSEMLSLSIDRACCSSMTATILGYQGIKSGLYDITLAVGAENMMNAPLLGRGFRWESKLGHRVLEDPLFEIGYKGAFSPVAIDAGEVALEHGVTREEQDLWSYGSQVRYQEALKAGKFAEEIRPIEVPVGRGKFELLEVDQCPRPEATLEKLAKLATVYGSPTVTAGNAPALASGASAMLLMSEKAAEKYGLEPLAEIVAVHSIALKPRLLAEAPAPAIAGVVEKAGLTLDQIDLIEINEAFAAMPCVASRILADGDIGLEKDLHSKINVNGGAVAVGHPVGASGARITMTLAYELRRRGGGIGAAAICGGLAQGDAVVVKV
jgi:acetyl-CoA C-acetyltransferase